MMRTTTFDTLADRKTKRPAESGVVTVVEEARDLWTRRLKRSRGKQGWVYAKQRMFRPVLVHGIVVPTTTKGRKAAPEPASGYRVGMTKRVPKKILALSARNRGAADMDKGHIMALELGGPDVPQNICPQFSLFQQSGEWRKMEEQALALAEYGAGFGTKVHMTVHVLYGSSPSFSRSTVPARFVVELRSDDAAGTIFHTYRIENTQSRNDDYRAAQAWAKGFFAPEDGEVAEPPTKQQKALPGGPTQAERASYRPTGARDAGTHSLFGARGPHLAWSAWVDSLGTGPDDGEEWSEAAGEVAPSEPRKRKRGD